MIEWTDDEAGAVAGQAMMALTPRISSSMRDFIWEIVANPTIAGEAASCKISDSVHSSFSAPTLSW